MKQVLALAVVLLMSLSRFAIAETDHGGSGGAGARHRAASTVTTNSFTVTRPLVYYGNRLGIDFMRDLAALDGNGHWIDAGSGEGVATEQYHQVGSNPTIDNGASADQAPLLNQIAARPANQRARVTGITYQMLRPGDRNYNGRLRHMTGRFLEDIPDGQIGKADLISDVYGVFAYSRRLDVTMQKYLTALKPNGKIYIYTANMDRSSIMQGTERITLRQWLSQIPGIRIETQGDAIKITKTGAPIQIPALEFRSDDHQAPPARVFKATGVMLDVPVTPAVAGAGADFTVSHRIATAEQARPLSGEQIDAMNQALGYTAHPPRR